jgi:outer membrane protein OmpA-like peptidoglycan-associated protein
MAGLMVIFLFIAIVYIRPLAEQRERVREIAVAWQEVEAELYEALVEEFEDDLPRWNAEIDREQLLLRFKSPDVLFARGASEIRPRFATILADFFPRYVETLEPFADDIEEVRIEGHTSSLWNARTDENEAYFRNMELSQERTRAVLKYVMNLEAVREERTWLRPLLTANGLSSSRLIRTADGAEDAEASRRVEFRVRTAARQRVVRILGEFQ